MYELAGYVGVCPDQYTFNELFLMARGKHKEEWQHTASIMAMIANTVRDPKKRRKPFNAEDFYPKVFRAKRPEVPRMKMADLKPVIQQAFMGNPHGNTRKNTGGTSIYQRSAGR